MWIFSKAIDGLLSKEIDQRNEWAYYLTQICHSLIFTIPIWIVYYLGKISPAEISILVTVQYLSQMVIELPSGALADLIGRKRTNYLGFLFGALSSLLFPFAGYFWHFVILAILVGISDSLRSGAEEALMYDTFKQAHKEDEFKRVYANGNIIYQVGLIIGAASGGFLFAVNTHLPYFLYGVMLLIGSFFVLRYIEPVIDSEKFSLESYSSQIVLGSKEAFKDAYTKTLSLYYILVGGITWASTLYFNGYMMVELGFSDSVRGLLSASMRLLNVVLISTVLKNTKIFNWQRTIFVFPLIMLFGFIPGPLLQSFFGLPFVQAIMIAATARWIILSPLTNDAFSSKYRATAISFLSLLIGFVYIALTTVSAIVIPQFGIKTMYFILGVLTLLTVVPLALKLARHEPNRS